MPPVVLVALLAMGAGAVITIGAGLRRQAATARRRAQEEELRAAAAKAFLIELTKSSYRREGSGEHDEPIFAATRRGRTVLVLGPRQRGETILEVSCETLPLEAGDRLGRRPTGRAQEDFVLALPSGHVTAVGTRGLWAWWNDRGRAKLRSKAAPAIFHTWLDDRADLLETFPDIAILPGMFRVSLRVPSLASLDAAVDLLCTATEQSEART